MIFQKLPHLFAAMLLSCALQVASFGQTPQQLPRLPEPSPRVAPPELLDLIETPELPDPATLRQPRRARQSPSGPQPLYRSFEAARRNEVSRLMRIREKLEKLKRIKESKQVGPQSSNESAALSTQLSTLNASAEQMPLPPTQAVVEKPDLIQVIPDVEPEGSQTTVPVHLTATVDRMSLANNLFAQNRTNDALPIYESLLSTPQKASDLVWIRYQLASCYRLQGNLKEANKLYRMVAAASEEEYWASRASWWLKYLIRAESDSKRQQELKTKLTALQKEFDETKKP